jgi:chemotaxis protein methyltransferase CheR
MKCSEEDREYLRKLVQTHSANVMDPSRDYFLESRLHNVAQQVGVDGIPDLVALLRHRPDGNLHRMVVEAMTINETSFFRDSAPFLLMERQLIPQLMEARRPLRRLRLWSAACSSGQEAYSLAILLTHHFPELAGWDVRIFGTDLSQFMIERARNGHYSGLEVARGLPKTLLDRYTQHKGHGWTMQPEIRALCSFVRLNLCAPMPLLPVFDAILLRNVMLYIAMDDRLRLLRTMYRQLASDGFLLLGACEQLPEGMDLFTTHLQDGACYFRPRP